MAIEDKNKWDKKHLDCPIPTDAEEIVKNNFSLANIGNALDIACGMGRHSKFLASQGFKVDAIDISSTAINSLQNIENINAKEVDLDNYSLEENKYDLIVCTYFLKRELFSQIKNALKEDGIFIYETYMYHPDNTNAPSNRSFLLEKGELEKTFSSDLKIIDLKEYWSEDYKGNKTMKAFIVAKKS